MAIVPSVPKDVVNMPGIRFKPLAGAPIDSAVAAIDRRQEPSAAVSRFIKRAVDVATWIGIATHSAVPGTNGVDR